MKLIILIILLTLDSNIKLPLEKMDSGLALKNPDSFHTLEIENIEINETEEGNFYLLINEKENLYLKAYQYEGDIEYSISLFEVGILGNIDIEKFEDLNKKILNNIDFYTSNKLKIGSTRTGIKELLKLEFQELDNKLIYKLDENISKYNMPSYYLEIELENEKVKRYIFGFEYP